MLDWDFVQVLNFSHTVCLISTPLAYTICALTPASFILLSAVCLPAAPSPSQAVAVSSAHSAHEWPNRASAGCDRGAETEGRRGKRGAFDFRTAAERRGAEMHQLQTMALYPCQWCAHAPLHTATHTDVQTLGLLYFHWLCGTTKDSLRERV